MGRGVYCCGPGMLAAVGGSGLGYTLDPGVDGNVDGRGITSPRPGNAPGCVVVANERDAGRVRSNDIARASGATRSAGIELFGTLASTMLGPRVIV